MRPQVAFQPKPADASSRGVLVEGPGASPQLLSDDPVLARRLLELVASLPNPVRGRDELRNAS